MLSRCDAVQKHDRQTDKQNDGQTDRIVISISRAAIKMKVMLTVVIQCVSKNWTATIIMTQLHQFTIFTNCFR